MENKKNIFTGGRTRTKVFTVISVLSVTVLLALNLLATYFGLHKTVFVDMTPEGLYTVTDRLSEELQYVEELSSPVRITFCADPDTLMKNEMSRLTYVMAQKLANEFENIELKAEDITYKPTLVDKYKSSAMTKITPSHVIISCGERYRIIGINNFWVGSSGVLYAYNGEYRLASVIKSITAIERPKAYFVTDHLETYYTPDDMSEGFEDATELYNLLCDRGLEVKTLKLSEVSEIPADCELLIINNPREDYTSTPDGAGSSLGYISETEKLDRYLTKAHGSIMIAKDYKLTLPILESFLYEWGFEFVPAQVRDPGSYLPNEAGDKTTLVGKYDTNENSYAYAIYGAYASLASSPNMVFKDTGYLTCSFGVGYTTPEPGTYAVTRNYDPFFYTSDKAEAYKGADPYVKGESLHIAAVATRLEINSITAEYKYSYIMCAPSADFFSTEILADASCANFDIMSALVENMARSDEYASSDLGGKSLNFANAGGKPLADMTIYSTSDATADTDKALLAPGVRTAYVVIIMLVPLAAAIVGIIVAIRRRYL
jgi:hypothetical protein